ncbi:helix-turn-helix domain-containing protein [bacterium]|nr:helix-turn-helix domain-containing protein [bacterium]
MSNDEIMTVQDVARYLKLQPQTIYKWAQEGKIPAAKFGKEWRFRKSLVDRWLDAQFASSPAVKRLNESD